MDIEKLIERLRTESLYADKASLEIMDLCMEAATALSTLQAENEKLRAELERCKEKNAGLALALLTECAPNPDCLGDDEWRAIRAELEKVTRERDAAVKCIEEIEDALNFQRMSAIGLRISEWRGLPEED